MCQTFYLCVEHFKLCNYVVLLCIQVHWVQWCGQFNQLWYRARNHMILDKVNSSFNTSGTVRTSMYSAEQNQGSSVRIVSSYGLDSQVWFLAGAVTSFHHCISSSPAGYPASYPSMVVKWRDHEAHHPPIFSASVVNVCTYTSISLYIFLYVVLI